MGIMHIISFCSSEKKSGCYGNRYIKIISDIYIFLDLVLKQHASRFMRLIFMKILKMWLKVLFSEITKREQFTNYQWHLQPT
jgi:hypothetical protein